MSLLASPFWIRFAALLALSLPSSATFASSDFAAAIEADPVLSGLTFEEFEPQRGLILHIELGESAEADRSDRIANELSELFAEVHARFEARFAGDATDAEIHIVVAATSETWRAARGPEAPPSPGGADFVPALGDHGALLTYDLAWPGSSRRSHLAGLRQAYVEALFASRAEVSADQLPGALLAGIGRLLELEDVGAALVRESTRDPAKKTRAASKPSLHDRLIAELVEGGFRDGFLSDADTLFKPLGLNGLWQMAQAKTIEGRDTDRWAARRFEAYVAQAAYMLAVGFDDPKTSAGLLNWITAQQAGDLSAESPLGELEAAAWARLLDTEHGAERSFDPRGLAGPPAFEAAVEALELPAKKNTGETGRPEDRLAEGLWLASKGRLEDAHAALELAASDPVVARNLAGIEALQTLRASYLAHLADSAVTEKLRIDYADKLLAADVTRVGRRSVFLADNSRDVDSLEITSIDIGELVGRMEKEKPAFGDAAARAWAQALVGGKWKRSLTTKLKKDKLLGADLAAVEAQLERGRILHLLFTIDDATSTGASQRLDAIKDLLTTAGSATEVTNARKHLQEVASTILTERFAQTDVTKLLATPHVDRDGDHLALEYKFESAAELSDWPTVANYSPQFLELFPEIKTKTLRRELDGKELVVQGSVVFQHLLAFAGPMKLTYEISYDRTKKKSQAKLTAIDYVFASICDDLDFQHLRASQFGNLDVVDNDSEINEQQAREKPLSYKLGQTYKLDIELDADGKVTTHLAGKEVFSSDSYGRRDGRLLFLVHSDRVVRLHSIKIEGQLADDQGPLLEMWLTGQLQELGF